MLLFNKFSLSAMWRLSLFTVLSLTIVSGVFFNVRKHIEAQTLQALLAQFSEITPQFSIDESLLDSSQKTTIAGIPVTLYIAKNQGIVQAYFIKASTNKGYNGNILLLIGIAADNHTLLGVRVIKHQETPGLGDKIDTRISDWIHEFDGQSLTSKKIKVKKDGGDIDQFSGATITPRAVTNLVNQILNGWEKSHQGIAQ